MKFLMRLFKHKRRQKNDIEVLVNECFGGFSFSDEAWEIIQPWCDDDDFEARTDPRVIKLYKERGSEFMSGEYSSIGLETIPSNATDWWIDDYDGNETLYYIVDGKRYLA